MLDRSAERLKNTQAHKYVSMDMVVGLRCSLSMLHFNVACGSRVLLPYLFSVSRHTPWWKYLIPCANKIYSLNFGFTTYAAMEIFDTLRQQDIFKSVLGRPNLGSENEGLV